MAAKIILQRRNEFLNKVRGIKVFIDGVERGTIKTGGSEEYIVEPGSHKIQCKISWYASRETEVVLNEGENKFLKVRMGMKYFGAAYIILLIAILSDLAPKLLGFAKPDWWAWGKLVVIVPLALYFLFYITLGRKHYLLLEEDRDNIFN